MTQNKIREIINKFAIEASRQYATTLNSVILYGSCARGDYNDDSDIDIMVLLDISPDQIPDARRKMRSFINQLNWDYDVMIAPVYQSSQVFETYKAASMFYQNVEREGLKVG